MDVVHQAKPQHQRPSAATMPAAVVSTTHDGGSEAAVADAVAAAASAAASAAAGGALLNSLPIKEKRRHLQYMRKIESGTHVSPLRPTFEPSCEFVCINGRYFNCEQVSFWFQQSRRQKGRHGGSHSR